MPGKLRVGRLSGGLKPSAHWLTAIYQRTSRDYRNYQDWFTHISIFVEFLFFVAKSMSSLPPYFLFLANLVTGPQKMLPVGFPQNFDLPQCTWLSLVTQVTSIKLNMSSVAQRATLQMLIVLGVSEKRVQTSIEIYQFHKINFLLPPPTHTVALIADVQ